MIIEFHYDVEFRNLFNKLNKTNFADGLKEIDGIGSQTDISQSSKKFFGKNKLTTADVSVDANSNVDSADVVQYSVEMAKPPYRLNAYYLMWKYATELFGEEIAEKMELPVDKVKKVQKISKEPISLGTPIGEEEDSSLGDFIEDKKIISPADAVMSITLSEQTRAVLATLTPREEKVLRMRFGIGEKSECYFSQRYICSSWRSD